MVTDARSASRTHGFLFADLRGYTHFVETHGDRAGASLLAAYRALVRDAVGRFEGSEIRTEGDSFFVVFPSASSAVECGLAISAAAKEASTRTPDLPIEVGIGVHAGETVETSEGPIGSAVNIAARVCAQAGAGEVVVTETVRLLTRTSLDVGWAPLGVRSLKGVTEAVPLYRVAPAGEAMPRSVARPRRRPVAAAGLGVAMGVALVAIVVVAALFAGPWLRGGAVAPTATASGSPGASASPSAAPSATTLTAAEAELLARIPSSVNGPRAVCGRAPAADVTPLAVASIRCDLPAGSGADTVWYERFEILSMLDESVDAQVRAHDVPAGDCRVQQKAIGTWDATPLVGRLACWQQDGSWLAWTYEPNRIAARAHRVDGDWVALYTWWWGKVGPYLIQ